MAAKNQQSSNFLFKMLEQKGVGRIEVESRIRTGEREEDLVIFKARFVAKK